MNIGITYLTHLVERDLYWRRSTWEIYMCLVVNGQADDGGEVGLWVVGKQREDEPSPIVKLKCGCNAESLFCVVVSNVRNADLA